MNKSIKSKKGSRKESGIQTKKSDRTRSIILQAALKHFSSTGYSATSIQDIVDEANFTKPTLYYYFSSKADLFSALIEQALTEFQAIIQQIVNDGDDVKDILTNIFLTMSKQAHEKGSIIRLIHYSFFAAEKEIPDREKCFEQASKFATLMEEFFSKKMAQGSLKTPFKSADIASIFIATLNHFTVAQLVKKDAQITSKRAEVIVSMFLKGIETR